jgi:hypothetical protein
MKPKVLDETEKAIIAGEPSRLAQRILLPHETLSREAWWLLCNLSYENTKRFYGTWHELHNYNWAGEHRRLIEPARVGVEYQLRLSHFGSAYQAAFRAFYHQRYGENIHLLTM